MSAFTVGRAPRSSTEAELAAFEDICERLSGFEPSLSPEWVDGWLAALASGPLRLPFEEWIALLADDAFERAFADPADQARARNALQARLDALLDQLDADALLDDPDALRLEPLMGEWTEDDRLELQRERGLTAEDAALMQTGALWSEGFCAGCADLLARWSSPALDAAATADLEAHLEAVKALQQPDDADEPAGATGPSGGEADVREQMIDAACLAVQDLRLWWLDHAPAPPPRRVAPEPGRNDLCPCGSGRKYKKCHGAT